MRLDKVQARLRMFESLSGYCVVLGRELFVVRYLGRDLGRVAGRESQLVTASQVVRLASVGISAFQKSPSFSGDAVDARQEPRHLERRFGRLTDVRAKKPMGHVVELGLARESVAQTERRDPSGQVRVVVACDRGNW
jgi:hypothetical protein